MKVNFSLIFEVSNYNGSMSIDIYQHDQLLYAGRDFDEGKLRVDVIIEWPGQLIIKVGNKNNNDALVDDTGFIIKHKFVDVVGVLINNFPINIDLLDKVFNCQKEGQDTVTHENFWGFNGTITVNFDTENPMRYLLAHNNQFDINRLTWNNNE